MAEKPRWAQMGLRSEEYEQIQRIMGREPNEVELGMFAVMWSEHCSYKHSRPVLSQFPTSGERVLQGPGENAGIVDIGDGWAVAMKIESHNHPSAIEPYQGAATGVGGIIRDVFTMGARPIALLNSLRFGRLVNVRQQRLFSGVVSGIGGYGNCMGIPTIGGETVFSKSYEGNPLVNAMCVGIIRHDAIIRGVASGTDNPVMIVGARTGRDGIHGATFASEELGEESEERRPAVQVGDPFMEKLLMEACLELIGTEFVVGIQDLGAAGLTSSASETASRGNGGIVIDVAKVPRREEGMTPYEVMLSESQERMLIIAKAGYENQVEKVFGKYGLTAVVIGKVTDDGLMRILDHDIQVAAVPVSALTSDAPTYYPEAVKPDYLISAWAWNIDEIPYPIDWNKAMMSLLTSENIANKEWVYRQYDSSVLTNSVIHPGADAGLIRLKGTTKGIALTTDCNGRYCYLDPYNGGMQAVVEAARNCVCTGARPIAVTDCLNFGSPEKPEIFWQFKESVAGMSAACKVLDTPVISGNVSFYNENEGEAIYPTPVVGMVGLLDDIERRCTAGWKYTGDSIIVLGVSRDDLGATEYLDVVHNRITGKPPKVDLQHEKLLMECVLNLIHDFRINTAHDISDGGLAVALAESCFLANPGAKGVEVSLEDNIRDDSVLFGETQGRVIVACSQENLDEVLRIAGQWGIPATVIGRVSNKTFSITVNKQTLINLDTETMEADWRGAIEWKMK
jgi:phosphoribosylformylglycinamidine synthase